MFWKKLLEPQISQGRPLGICSSRHSTFLAVMNGTLAFFLTIYSSVKGLNHPGVISNVG